MRIKLATNTPLPKYNCWFGISEKQEKQTIHHLRKKIAHDLNLESEPSNLQLLLDGFSLLPQTTIRDLVRDGDLITVKAQSTVKSKTKKRKISSSSAEEKDDIELSPPAKKKSKKSTEKDSKTKQVSPKKESKKKSAPAKEKTEKKRKVEKTEKKSTPSIATPKKIEKKHTPSVEAKEKTEKKSTEKPKPKSLPFQGTTKTQKRNMRRKLLKQHRAIADALTPTTEPDTVAVEKEITTPAKSKEAVVENLSVSNIEEPLQLIKKNKNKKKNHLKQAEQRTHVHYAAVEEEVSPAETNSNASTANTKNAHGRAFVTFVEVDNKYKAKNNTNGYTPREYPINRVPTLFYAAEDQPLEEEEVVEEEIVEQSESASFKEPVVEIEVPEEASEEKQAPINYEETYPTITFADHILINSTLAIKTLELTAAYTPEISDWKEVYLRNLNKADDTVTFEYLPGFGKASTKGGKFDFKKKKNYNDYYYNEEQYQEEEEEEQEEKEITISCSDVFAMRIMST